MTVKSVTGITDVRYAAVKGTAWGIDALCGAGSGIYGVSDGFTKKQPLMPNMATGVNWEDEADMGIVDAPWGHNAELTYDGLMLLLAMALGTSPVPTKVGATLAYKHQMQLADDKAGLFFTYVKNYLAALFVGPSVKVTGIKISGPNKDGRIDVAFTGVAFDQLTGTATNTLTTFANVTWPYKGNRVLFKQGVWRMNAQSDAALASGDAIKAKSFELDITWPLKGEVTTEFGDRIDEPTKDGRPTVSLKLVFPRFDDDGKARIDAFDAGTLYKLDLTFTSTALIEAGYPWSMHFMFPQLAIEVPDQPFNAATIPQTVTFRGQAAQAAPLGMATVDIGYDLLRPVGLDVVNTQSVGALA